MVGGGGGGAAMESSSQLNLLLAAVNHKKMPVSTVDEFHSSFIEFVSVGVRNSHFAGLQSNQLFM